MQFRFECTSPSEFNDNTFADIEYPTNLHIVHEFEMTDGVVWDNIMLQFAKFLDATGYVGAYEKVDSYVTSRWKFVTQGTDNEDISHPGLSD